MLKITDSPRVSELPRVKGEEDQPAARYGHEMIERNYTSSDASSMLAGECRKILLSQRMVTNMPQQPNNPGGFGRVEVAAVRVPCLSLFHSIVHVHK